MDVSDVTVGSHVRVRACVRLGALDPDEVSVELYVGRIDARGEIADGLALPMQPDGRATGDGVYFELPEMSCSRSGLQGYTVRITPYHVDLPETFLPGLIVWADAK
jgi:glycogen phosphorylase